jgi:RNA-directed DNA polymerase
LVRFVENSKRTRFLLQLFGGADYLFGFIRDFEKHMRFFKAPNPQHPVIIFLDNDEGPEKIEKQLQSKSFNTKTTLFPAGLDPQTDARKTEFIHVLRNLYVVFTPLGTADSETDIEYFFDDATRLKQHSNGLCFNTVANRDKNNDLSKDSFANHIVKAQKKSVNFEGFKPLLDRVVKVINHYDSIK